MVLGSPEFLREVQKGIRGERRERSHIKALEKRPDWTEVAAAVASVRGLSWKQLREYRGDWGRDLAWYFGRRECGLSLKALGKVSGGVDYATVSAAVKRMERRLAIDGVLAEKARKIK